jgi:hypothetical protein
VKPAAGSQDTAGHGVLAHNQVTAVAGDQEHAPGMRPVTSTALRTASTSASSRSAALSALVVPKGRAPKLLPVDDMLTRSLHRWRDLHL